MSGNSLTGTSSLNYTGVDNTKKIGIAGAVCVLFLVGMVQAGRDNVLSYASMETEYNDISLLVEGMWYKVPAIDVIEATILSKGCKGSFLCPEFYLQYPDGDRTSIANVPVEGEGCLGELVSVKFYIWCHDLGGWSVFYFEDGAFVFIGRTKLDFPVGEWVIVVVDRETGDTVAELPLHVEISKPTMILDRFSQGVYHEKVE
ncbi:MAG: hypothetical protein HXS41_07840 [Theionarchaea archaeon]|nr:hypothetical protein [Theionarchaea archaeon]MBU7001853.1 hypothetical protein [Theionarchaea archaeon]MBU7020957.1 hypothetical protein [Theionarchaea archaeon]MBU7034010.1 hypothetical protein [Theionarchaea archaeon]MBU7041036.1 hypothetical protein [Theionarchaea archaeon]